MSFNIKKKFLIFTFLLLSSINFTSPKIKAGDFGNKYFLGYLVASLIGNSYVKLAKFICSEIICSGDEDICYDSCCTNFGYAFIVPLIIFLSKKINDRIPNML